MKVGKHTKFMINFISDFIRHIPNYSHLKKMIEEEQETLRNDLLKTDIPSLPEYFSLLDFKV